MSMSKTNHDSPRARVCRIHWKYPLDGCSKCPLVITCTNPPPAPYTVADLNRHNDKMDAEALAWKAKQR